MYYDNQGQYDPDEDFFDNGFDDYSTIPYSDIPERQSGDRVKEETSAARRSAVQGVGRDSRGSADSRKGRGNTGSSRGSAGGSGNTDGGRSSRRSADVSRGSADGSPGREGGNRERLRQRRERERKARERKRRILIAAIAGGSAAAALVILLSVRFVMSRNAAKKQDALRETAAASTLSTVSEAAQEEQLPSDPDDMTPEQLEKAKAKRGLSADVASFALGYKFKETGATAQIPLTDANYKKMEQEKKWNAAIAASAAGTTPSAAEDPSESSSQEEPAATTGTAPAGAVGDDYVDSDYAILVNADTNEIVAERNPQDKICPASMTKVLTVLVAAEHIDDSKLQDTQEITQDITDLAYINDASNVGYMPGDKPTVEEMFYGTILESGADAAMGLADYVAGSQDAFVKLMNDKLDELGLSATSHFTNVVGLYDKDHYTTVHDMAVIMKAAMENDFVRKVMTAHTYTCMGAQQVYPEGRLISNWFLRRIEDKDTHGTVLCAKTGYVTESGNCAVSYQLSNDGGHYICVTALAAGNWRAIRDHVALYQEYTK